MKCGAKLSGSAKNLAPPLTPPSKGIYRLVFVSYADFAIGKVNFPKMKCGAKLSGSAKTSAPPSHFAKM